MYGHIRLIGKDRETNMDKQVLFKQLYDARKLSSNDEIGLFEDAMEKLCDSITIDDVYEICKAFYDDTEEHEVMFGMIHLIEQLAGEDYLKCIAISTPEMIEANEWAMVLNKSILNSEKYFNMYVDVIKSLESGYQEKILEFLIDVKNDCPERFGEKVDFIFNSIK